MPGQNIDTKTRRLAAELIDSYLAGEITGHEAADAWPESAWDIAATKIGEEILPEIRGARLTEEFGPVRQEQLQAVLGRCRLFLDCERPYAWNWVTAPGCAIMLIGALAILTGLWALSQLAQAEYGAAVFTGIGTVLLMGLWLTIRERRGRLAAMTTGSLRHWPFETEQDLRLAEEP